MIEVNNLIKKFGDFRALDGVNMHVASGNIYGLVGPNGAGKSTLIRHLTGVYRQDAGEIFIDGAPGYENKQVKAQMAYIPDEPFYFLQADTLEMMRYFRGMYESFDEKMFYRLQEFFPGIDMKRNIRRLSRGMQKQVAFWLALCCRPKLLILDEPQKMGKEDSATQKALKKFNPLFTLNYSATHAKQHNLIYVLDALDAYNKRLVKKIEVKGFEVKNLRGTDKYLYLESIIISPKNPPRSKFAVAVKHQTGTKR